MTRDPRPPSGVEPPDDARLEQLVRDVVGTWTMPPVRLDAPLWRDRVRSPGVRRLGAAQGWLTRAGQAAMAAIALTVAAALVAIVLTAPPDDAAKSPEPSEGSTPGATDAPKPSRLPTLLLEGELPSPSDVLVQTERGDFAIVDLEKGSIGEALAGARYGSDVRVLADGSLLCLCLSTSNVVDGSPTTAEVTLHRYDAAGGSISSTPIETFVGEPDPRDAGRFIPARPPHVVTAMTCSTGASSPASSCRTARPGARTPGAWSRRRGSSARRAPTGASWPAGGTSGRRPRRRPLYSRSRTTSSGSPSRAIDGRASHPCRPRATAATPCSTGARCRRAASGSPASAAARR
jgi:hypothetical protein